MTAVVTAIASTAMPPAGISSRRGGIARRRLKEGQRSRERRGKPAATRSSSSAANWGCGVGRSARRSSASRSSLSLGVSIAGLPQFGHCPVQAGAGVRLADAEHSGDLTVLQAGEELERDQLALGWIQLLQRRRDRQLPLAVLGALVEGAGVDVLRLRRQLRLAAAAPQLV